MLRLFFAVTLPDDLRRIAQVVQESLRASAGDEGIGWEAPGKFHYTLKFLGDVAEEQLLTLSEAARSVAGQVAPFSLALAGVGVFPRQRLPQILWIGADEGVPHLARLAELLDETLGREGFEREMRPYHPHLTLARARLPEGQEAIAKTLAASLADLKKVDRFGVFRVENFVLMSSELRATGSVYTVLEWFALTPM